MPTSGRRTPAMVRIVAPLLLLALGLAARAVPSGQGAGGGGCTPALLLVTQERRSAQVRGGDAAFWGQQIRPIDPVTLADVPGIAPHDLGARVVTAAGMDGRTLAAFVYDAPLDPFVSLDAGAATLHLIDLVSWRDSTLDLRVGGVIEWLRFAPDGQALYWLVHDGSRGGEVRPMRYSIARYDLRRRSVTTVAGLAGPLLDDPGVTTQWRGRGSGWLALYYIPADALGHPSDAPHILRLDLSNDRMRYDRPITGVRDGIFPSEEGVGRIIKPGLAWDLDGERLYIVHADADRLTTVGLADGAILDQSPLAGVSPPRAEDFSPWETTGRIGDAGILLGASVGAGGSRLFIAGQTIEIEALPGGGARERYIARGVRVIDPARHAEIARLDSIAFLGVSPDGTRLVGYTARYARGQPVDEPDAFRLRVYDTGSLREMARLDVSPGDLWPVFFSTDGRSLYVMRPQGGTLARAAAVPWAVSGGRPLLARFDLEAGEVAAERTDGAPGGLIPLWPLP